MNAAEKGSAVSADQAVVYREVLPGEFEEYVALDAYAFAYDVTPESVARMRRMTPLDGTLAAFAGREMLAHMHIRRMDFWLNGGSVPAGGVADVAAWPEHRRSGYTGELLRRSLG